MKMRHVRIPLNLCLLVTALCQPQAVRADSHTQTYTCRPALPVFCRNVHVGCSGRTKIPTAEIEVVLTGTTAQLNFADRATVVSGQITKGDDLVINLADDRAWIRIQADGRYSHRIYPDGKAAMSYGICE